MQSVFESIARGESTVLLVWLALAAGLLFVLYAGIYVVPQAQNYVVERFGRFHRVLKPGLNIIVPLLDNVQHRLSILERPLGELKISVITKDNVEIVLHAAIFLRVREAQQAVYRVEQFEDAVRVAGNGLIRNTCGKLDLDEIQGARDRIANDVSEKLGESASTWGVEITRVEIIDVEVDDVTKDSQRRQLQAERERRATVMEADGVREAIELKARGDRYAVEQAADAALYEARQQAEAKRVQADAEAYAVRTIAEAQAQELDKVGEAIAGRGETAARFEVAKRQVEALGKMAQGDANRIVIVPTQATAALGAVEVLRGLLQEPDAPKGGGAT